MLIIQIHLKIGNVQQEIEHLKSGLGLSFNDINKSFNSLQLKLEELNKAPQAESLEEKYNLIFNKDQ